MSPLKPEELFRAEWIELDPSMWAGAPGVDSERFVWTPAKPDSYKRTLAYYCTERAHYVVVRDSNERVTQVWAVRP